MNLKTPEELFGNNYNLLLVEDNPAHARLVIEILRGTPCGNSRITQVTTLSEALLKVSVERFDLVLLDLGLPEARGMETFTRFHAAAPSQPVVVLTSIDDSLLALKIVKSGAEDYLPKEEMANSLCRTIRHAVERSQLSRHLLEREQQLRTILNSNLDGLVVIDQKGHTLYTNTAAQKMLGADGAHRLMSYVQQVGDMERPTVLSFAPDEGPSVVAEIRAASITWEQNLSYLVSIRDITLRSQIEKKLHQTQKMEMVGTLTSGIAHDFNNLLSAISGYAQLVATNINDENGPAVDLEDDMNCILEAVERGKFLIRDLLHLGQPQKIEKKQQVNINELLHKTEKLVAATIRKTHNLYFSIPEARCYINAAPENLEQVFINMIMNARDATEKGGELLVKLCQVEKHESFMAINGEAPSGKYICVIIQDNGSGISPEVCSKIFEPFFTTKEQGKGTGLGMFVVSRIVKQHAGWIIYDTELEKGTTFSLYFPRVNPEG